MDVLNKNLSIVEALILASPDPIAPSKISDLITDMTPKTVGKAVDALNEKYIENGISFRIRKIALGFQFYIIPEYAGFVEELFSRRRKLRLTRAALEVMALVAYKQPVTKTDIELIRGVASDGVLHNLLEKKLITVTGRAETVGKPLQYGTTDEFLKFFGLNKVDDLPKMEEIEELIKSNEPDNQTELSLPQDKTIEPEEEKLNVSDGTFTPESEDREMSDSEFIEEKTTLPEPEDEMLEAIENIDTDIDSDAGEEIVDEDAEGDTEETELETEPVSMETTEEEIEEDVSNEKVEIET